MCSEPAVLTELCALNEACKLPSAKSGLYWIKIYQLSNRTVRPVDQAESLVLVGTRSELGRVMPSFQRETILLKHGFGAPAFAASALSDAMAERKISISAAVSLVISARRRA